jgi:hypothetical protein
MTFRLLIDECLSPDLVDLAVDAGHVESTCLRDRELLATKDWFWREKNNATAPYSQQLSGVGDRPTTCSS